MLIDDREAIRNDIKEFEKKHRMSNASDKIVSKPVDYYSSLILDHLRENLTKEQLLKQYPIFISK